MRPNVRWHRCEHKCGDVVERIVKVDAIKTVGANLTVGHRCYRACHKSGRPIGKSGASMRTRASARCQPSMRTNIRGHPCEYKCGDDVEHVSLSKGIVAQTRKDVDVIKDIGASETSPVSGRCWCEYKRDDAVKRVIIYEHRCANKTGRCCEPQRRASMPSCVS